MRAVGMGDSFSPASVADLLECEPACAATILALAQRQAAGPVRQRHSVRLVLDRLDANDVRDGCCERRSPQVSKSNSPTSPGAPTRKDLILHCLAVACCARGIAEAAGIDLSLAWSAGLLHDIGKFASRTLCPRVWQPSPAIRPKPPVPRCTPSSTVIWAPITRCWESSLPSDGDCPNRSYCRSGCTIAILGPFWPCRRCARIAMLVKAADSLARQAGIGQSGSFDPPASLRDISGYLGVPAKSLQQIQETLPAEVKRRAEILGWEMPQATRC